MEDNATTAIVTTQEPREWYESILDNLFQPHKMITTSSMSDKCSIDIDKASKNQIDDIFEVGQIKAHKLFLTY